jgi:hypothetical protein
VTTTHSSIDMVKARLEGLLYRVGRILYMVVINIKFNCEASSSPHLGDMQEQSTQ